MRCTTTNLVVVIPNHFDSRTRPESTVAFPNISTGVYHFPLDRAALVVATAVHEWLAENDHEIREVRFVCFEQANFDLYVELLAST